MTAISQHTIDPAIMADVEALQLNIAATAKKGKVSKALQDYSTAKLLTKWTKNEHVEIILFSEKIASAQLNQFFNWLQINDKLDATDLFEKSQSIKLSDFEATLYHIDNRKIKKIDEAPTVLKIIYVDNRYIESEDWEIALALLDVTNSICVFVSDQSSPILEEICTASANYYMVNLQGEAQIPFTDVINQENVYTKFPLIQVCHYIDYLQQVNYLVRDELKTDADLLFGKSIINYQKQLISDRKTEGVSTKQSGLFKTRINQKAKSTLKEIEAALEQLEAHDEDINSLKTKLSNFVGFKAIKGSKNLTLKIPPTAVDHFSQSMQHALNSFYETKVNHVNQVFDVVENDIRTELKEKHIDLTKFKASKQNKDKLTQTTAGFNFEKPYEKQITKKGIGQLLMDLRTPIFMLMPFMMIAGVFGSLMGGKDVGQINEATIFYQNRHCIVVEQLPQYYNGEFRVFINELDNKRTKGFFDKALIEELDTEPQLAVVNTTIATTNKRQQDVKELDYDYDSRQAQLYLFLTENADRQFVINQLFNPALSLLYIEKSGGRMMGMAGLARALSGLSDYRYFIIVGLISLVVWFVITRKKSMHTEMKEAREKEQKRLKLDLKTDIERATQQSNGKWKARLNDYVNEYQQALIQFIENGFNKGIDHLKEQKIQETDIIQKRANHIKTERRNMMTLLSDQQRNASKVSSLQAKLKRQINRNRR